MTSSSFDKVYALGEHREKLLVKKQQLELLIANVEKTLASTKGGYIMKDKEKFKGFKAKMVEDNEMKYGEEIRKKYGNDTVEKSNAKVKNMTQEQYEEVTRLGEQIMETLAEAMLTGDPASDTAQKAAEMHKQWITYYWSHYSKEAHAGLAQMYVDDERFRAYYDVKKTGTAEFLRDAIIVYTGVNCK